jgi:hypothetical protein
VLFISAIIHVAITGLYVDAIASGIESHSWREPELAALQKQLGEIQLLPAVGGALRAERAGICHLLDISSANEFMRATAGSSKQVSDLGWWFVPGGWIYQNKAVIATLEGNMLASIDLTNETVSPYKVAAAGYAAEEKLRQRTPWNFIAAISVPNFSKATENMARNQTWVDHARIVCALERWRLANRKYPDTLTALVPGLVEKIPHDIINGKPMSYARMDDQNFRLYSVGWNDVDDGGITAHTSDGNEDRDFGDWTWHYPTQ